MVNGVIFDMDGTMFDTERLYSVAWKRVGEEWGYDISGELMDYCRGKTAEAIGDIFRDRFGMDFDYDGVRARKHEIFSEMIERDGIPLKPGLMELLGFLRECDIPAAVATSTARIRGEKMLRMAGVYEYFTGYVYGDSVKASKPEPDIFWKAAEELGRKPEECLVIEDTTPGVMAGKAAGGYVIHVPDLVKVPEEVKKGISAEFPDLGKVIGWIKCENQRKRQE